MKNSISVLLTLFWFAAAQPIETNTSKVSDTSDTTVSDTIASLADDTINKGHDLKNIIKKEDTAQTNIKTSEPFPSSKQHQTESLKLVKRTYGRKQVLLATVMMVFVVLIMTAAQQWNPR